MVTVSSQATFYCLLLWDCYVFRKVPYIPHMICMGTAWDYPIAKPYDPILCLWDFYVFRKVPQNFHSIWVFLSDMGMLWDLFISVRSLPNPYVPGITLQTMGNLWYIENRKFTHIKPIAWFSCTGETHSIPIQLINKLSDHAGSTGERMPLLSFFP